MLYCKFKLLQDKVRFAYYFLQYLCARLLCPLYKRNKEYQDLWIISERGVDARDNGYHLFRYIRTRHPDINVCYIISKDSKDRGKVSSLGKVINYRSFKHMMAFVLSDIKISTHVMGFSPDLYFFKILDMKWKVNGKKIFLQHGITINDAKYLYASENHISLFTCVTQKECKFVKEKFGYSENVAKVLGFARYDALPVKNMRERRNTILLMPTWRLYLQRLSAKAFVKSEYFKHYQSLLSSRRLDAILEKYGYCLKFYPHHEIQPYLKCFSSPSKNIILQDESKEDVQKNLIDADILITDYSSVLYDFAYMEKPSLYYQFDKEAFYNGHYNEGYFSYERDGFGKIVCSEEELLDYLEQCLDNGAVIDGFYRKRIDDFFELRDNKNCERIFYAIKELEKGDINEENP